MSDDPYKRDRRLGRWVISGKRYMEQAGLRMIIQRDVEIVHMAHHGVWDAVECIGRGPQFDIVEEGDVIPEYRPSFDGVTVTWERA
jgi:hypothetical protein